MNTTPETTRHPDWIKVEPGDGVIRKGDRYRIEYASGRVHEASSARDWGVTSTETYFVWPRPEPKPWEAIPEGRENAAVMAVSIEGQEPVVGTYWLDSGWLHTPDGRGRSHTVATRITSAVPVTVVPTDALNELRAAWLSWLDTDVTHGSVVKAAAAFLATIYGADQ